MAWLLLTVSALQVLGAVGVDRPGIVEDGAGDFKSAVPAMVSVPPLSTVMVPPTILLVSSSVSVAPWSS